MSIAFPSSEHRLPTPAKTSRAGIVGAARRILDAEGIDGVTMQRVARSVGVRAPSLYKHVPDRDALITLLTESISQELGERLEAAAGALDPRGDLHALADAFREFAHRWPAAYGLLFRRRPADADDDPSVDARAAAAVLRAAESLVGRARSLHAARMLTAFAHGFVSMELAGTFRLGGDVDAAWQYGLDHLIASLAKTKRARASR